MSTVQSVLGWSGEFWTTWSHLNSIGREINREDLALVPNKSTQLYYTHLTDLTTGTFPWKDKNWQVFLFTWRKQNPAINIKCRSLSWLLLHSQSSYWWISDVSIEETGYSLKKNTHTLLEYSSKCLDYIQNDVKSFLFVRKITRLPWTRVFLDTLLFTHEEYTKVLAARTQQEWPATAAHCSENHVCFYRSAGTTQSLPLLLFKGP